MNKYMKRNNSNSKAIIPIITGGVLLLVTVSSGILALSLDKSSNYASTSSIPTTTIFSPIVYLSETPNTYTTIIPTTLLKVGFKDGTYTENGNYESPIGPSHIKVTITIKNSNIVSVNIGDIENNTNGYYQQLFNDGVNPTVVGKPIDSSFDLSVINGASLIGSAFQEAIDKIQKDSKS